MLDMNVLSRISMYSDSDWFYDPYSVQIADDFWFASRAG